MVFKYIIDMESPVDNNVDDYLKKFKEFDHKKLRIDVVRLCLNSIPLIHLDWSDAIDDDYKNTYLKGVNAMPLYLMGDYD